ncbi:hypothetical protein EVAR_98198_1 [Eumeta japonica]|uniref:Uncharacterized protein n=1 Tax=Eumeta variegata TaxID=151549 RepID=A0A4C1Y3Z6_EUMVA|nr:hypothetical protein EVAR_98198_1 [Eumeta japonica]
MCTEVRRHSQGAPVALYCYVTNNIQLYFMYSFKIIASFINEKILLSYVLYESQGEVRGRRVTGAVRRPPRGGLRPAYSDVNNNSVYGIVQRDEREVGSPKRVKRKSQSDGRGATRRHAIRERAADPPH